MECGPNGGYGYGHGGYGHGGYGNGYGHGRYGHGGYRNGGYVNNGEYAKIMTIVILKATHSLLHITRVILRNPRTKLNRKCMRILNRMKLLHILITLIIVNLYILTKKLHMLILQIMNKLRIVEIHHNTKD